MRDDAVDPGHHMHSQAHMQPWMGGTPVAGRIETAGITSLPFFFS
jgi:hypothetical protein